MRGSFFVDECALEMREDFPEYGFTPARYATVRFEDVLQIIIQEHSVDFVEGDVLIIRIDGLEALRSSEQRPIVLPLSREQNQANASLNLFETCPRRPTLRAVTGTVTFDRFTVAENPEDSGDQETIAGSLTAEVVSADPTVSAGMISSEFDFIPPSRAPNEPVFP